MAQFNRSKLNKMRILILITIFTVFCIAQNSYADENEIDQHLRSFLDLLVNTESFGPDVINNLYDIEKESSNSDEIYVSLIDYYLGAGGTECLDELITKRGKRILSLLMVKSEKPVECTPKYEAACIKSIEQRNSHINELIEAIKRGIVLCPDNDNCPKVQK